MYEFVKDKSVDQAAARRTRIAKATVGGLLVLALVSALFSGCNQETKTPQVQDTKQKSDQENTNDQEQGTQGSQVFVNTWVVNAPSRGAMPGAPGGPNVELANALVAGATSQPGDDDAIEQVVSAAGDVTGTDAGYAMAGISIPITITTGGTAPSQAGTNTSTQTPTQNPSQSQTVSPVQDVKPEFSTSVNAAFAPGGMIDQLATAVGKGSVSDLSKQNQQDLRAAYAKGLESGQWAEFWKLAGGLLGIEPPAAGGAPAPPTGGGVSSNTPQEIPQSE